MPKDKDSIDDLKPAGKQSPAPSSPNGGQSDNPKPYSVLGVVVVGFLLIILSVAYLRLVMLGLLNQFVFDIPSEGPVTSTQMTELLVMTFSAGVGSMIYAIRAYLKHASEDKDFDARYIPWYIFWSVQGVMLGLIFYFAIRGGFLVLTVSDGNSSPDHLNIWSLAAVGALVGLFSKYAIIKLREVFLVIFSEDPNLKPDDDKKDTKPEDTNSKTKGTKK